MAAWATLGAGFADIFSGFVAAASGAVLLLLLCVESSDGFVGRFLRVVVSNLVGWLDSFSAAGSFALQHCQNLPAILGVNLFLTSTNWFAIGVLVVGRHGVGMDVPPRYSAQSELAMR